MSELLFSKAKRIVEERGMLSLLGLAGISVDIQRGHENRQNKSVRCLFPSHDDEKPSAQIYEDHRFWCHACGRGAQTIDLIAEIQGSSPVEVAKWIANLEQSEPVAINHRAHHPPTQKAHQDAASSSPFELSKEALAVLNHYWTLLKDRPLCAASKRLIESRALDPTELYALGVRSTAPDLIPTLAAHHSRQAGVEAGLIDATNKYSFGKGEGILIPSWVGGFDFPLSWRFRPTHFKKTKEYGLAGAGRTLPLGLSSLEKSSISIVILCEGVPDYLSLATSQSIDQEEVAVVGLLGRNIPIWFINRLTNVDRYPTIIDMTHCAKREGQGIGERIKRYWNDSLVPATSRPKLAVCNASEDLDWNDRLKRGELNRLLLGWLGGVKSKLSDPEKRPSFGSKDHRESFYQVELIDEGADEELPEFLKISYRGETT